MLRDLESFSVFTEKCKFSAKGKGSGAYETNPHICPRTVFWGSSSHRIHDRADVTPLGASARAHQGIELAEARDRIRG